MSRARCAFYRVKLRTEHSAEPECVKVTDAATAFAVMREHFEDITREHLVVLYLSARGEPMACETVSVGTTNGTISEPRDILRPAVALAASAVIIAHNHPSGSLDPSEQDWMATRKLGLACVALGFRLLDALIVGHEGKYASLRELAHAEL